MGNLITYLEWRGDLTFKQSPFNEVDNLILSQFSYVNLDNIAPGPDTAAYISIKDAKEQFFLKYSEEELQQKFTPGLREVFDKETKRPNFAKKAFGELDYDKALKY